MLAVRGITPKARPVPALGEDERGAQLPPRPENIVPAMEMATNVVLAGRGLRS